MKIKLFILAIVIAFSTCYVHAQDRLFSNLSDNKNVSAIIISKALLSLAGNVDMGNIDSNKLLEKIDNVEIYKSENKKAFKQMKKDVDKVRKNKDYEILMKAKNDGEDISCFAKKSYGDTYSDIILPMEEGNRYMIIRMTGTFTLEDIQNAISNIK